MEKLTVHCYAENLEEERRITISPSNVTVVAANIEDKVLRGLTPREVAVLFADGGSIELLLNYQDMETLEQVVGLYSFG